MLIRITMVESCFPIPNAAWEPLGNTIFFDPKLKPGLFAKSKTEQIGSELCRQKRGVSGMAYPEEKLMQLVTAAPRKCLYYLV